MTEDVSGVAGQLAELAGRQAEQGPRRQGMNGELKTSLLDRLLDVRRTLMQATQQHLGADRHPGSPAAPATRRSRWVR